MEDGIVYEGCYDEQPQEFYGTSAAQSTLFPVIDAVLGVSHSNAYMLETLEYMPRGHRQLVQHLRSRRGETSVEAYLATTGHAGRSSRIGENRLTVEKTFVRSRRSLTRFRSAHLQVVQTFIVAEMERQARANGGEGGTARGTGGTEVLGFLKPLRDASRPAKTARRITAGAKGHRTVE